MAAPSDRARAAQQRLRAGDAAKVPIYFKAIGRAPILRTSHYRISAFNRFLAVVQFLRHELQCAAGDHLHVYINGSFSPSLDDTAYASSGYLIVNYSTTPAWG
ncbi:Ubiquitin-like protein [Malassezia sp. CBS 17886]|nr:Ubiquitin-like protein [Malassezia sp. CBS 17886]